MLFTSKIRTIREEKNIPQKKIAAVLDIDTPMYSRIERGERPAKKEQVIILAKMLELDELELINEWIAEKIYFHLKDEKNPIEIIEVVKELIIEYGRNKK